MYKNLSNSCLYSFAMKAALLTLVVLGSIVLVGCEEGDTNVTLPTAPDDGSGGGGGACTAPTTNNANLSPAPPCPVGGPCIVNGTVAQQGAKRTLWSNASCTPKETDSFGPAFNCPGPGTYFFRNILCNSTAADDPDNDCCRPVDLSVSVAESP